MERNGFREEEGQEQAQGHGRRWLIAGVAIGAIVATLGPKVYDIAESAYHAHTTGSTETPGQAGATSTGTATNQNSLPTPTGTAKPAETAPASQALTAPTNEECIAKIPLYQRVDTVITLNLTEASIPSSVGKFQEEHPVERLITKLPSKNGVYDISAIHAVRHPKVGIPAITMTDQEGGKVARLKDTTNLPAEYDLGSLSADGLESALTTNYIKLLRDKEITMNLAPVVDTGADPTETFRRTFKNTAEAMKYTPIYLKAATNAGIVPTLKHFPNLLFYGNTDLKPVTTDDYSVILKSGALEPYKLVNGTNAAVMMSSARTTGFDKKLDNGQINVWNPAAYAALNKLTGGKNLIMTDDLANAKAVNTVPQIEKRVLKALEAGADMALVGISPKGSLIPDTEKAIVTSVGAAIQSGEYTERQLDTSVGKILELKQIPDAGDTPGCKALEMLQPNLFKKLVSTKLPAGAKQ